MIIIKKKFGFYNFAKHLQKKLAEHRLRTSGVVDNKIGGVVEELVLILGTKLRQQHEKKYKISLNIINRYYLFV